MDSQALHLIRNLSLSYEIALAIGNSLDLQEMLDQVIRTIVRKTGAHHGSVWLRCGDRLELIAGAGFRVKESNMRQARTRLARKLGEILDRGQPLAKTGEQEDFEEYWVPLTGKETKIMLIPIDKLVLIHLVFSRRDLADEGLVGILAGIAPKLKNAVLSCLYHDKELEQQIEETRWFEDAFQRSEAEYRNLVSNLNVGIYRSTVAGDFLDANPAFLKMFGFADLNDLATLRWPSLYANPEERQCFVQAITTMGYVKNLDMMFIRKGGETFWAQVTAVLSSFKGEKHVMGIVEDVTERKRLEIQLRESEARYRLLAESALAGVYLIQDGLFRYVNPALAAIFGYRRDEIEGKLGPLDLTVPEDRPTVVENIRRRVEGEIEAIHYTFRGLRKDGTVITCEVLGKRADYNERPALFGTLIDVTERKQVEDRMRYLGTHDVLTGLYNRAYFEEVIERMRDDFTQYPVTVVMCDVNGLKMVNDTLGHAEGDELLRAAAGVLRRCFRDDDIIARIGGDEFASILPQTGEQQGEGIAWRIAETVEAYNRQNPARNNPAPVLSISVGVATAEWPHRLLDEALKIADRAMYTNKAAQEMGVSGRFIRSLLAVLAERDLETEEHTLRLKKTAVLLGQACGLKEAEISALATLALVHDIGKVGVPDHILLKPSALTPKERVIMEGHAEIGYRIAMAAPELCPVAEYILHHHEWWDGKGYPSGLKGEEIPIACRVLAIVDAYDAMTNARPYRQPMSKSEAVAELRRCAGRQFDPELVEKFIPLIDRAPG